MKNILLIGIGGTGSAAVDLLYRKMETLGNRTDNKIRALLFQMETGKVEEVRGAQTIPMVDNASVGRVCDRIGPDQIGDWFPWNDEDIRAQSMTFGVSLWRKKAYLAFLNLMYKKESRLAFHHALEEMANSEPGSTYEIYVISSIAGATGSGTFIPIALYAKRYIRQHLGITPTVSAMIACPDIYVDHLVPENVDKAYANAYAAMRELNAINQVARSGCNRSKTLKKTAVNFRLGAKSEPVVGILFDSNDPRYWRPDAAPFDKVYVLDRIPGVHRIEEHNVVLADSLYTLICTTVGSAVDAESSNHMTLTSQNNGGSAIFASISTSRIKFPIDTVLDYLAAERTLRICKDQWLTLHNATALKIEELRQRAVERREVFTLSEGQYADVVLDAYETLLEEENNIQELVDRWTLVEDEEGNRLGDTAEEYFEEMRRLIDARAYDNGEALEEIRKCKINHFAEPDEEDALYPMLRGRKNIDIGRVKRAAPYFDEKLTACYAESLEAVRSRATGISDAVLTFDEHRDPRSHKQLSMAERILIRNGQFMHPVAALVQICRLRQMLTRAIAAESESERLLPLTNDKKIPLALYRAGYEPYGQNKRKKSAYYRMGDALKKEDKQARFAIFLDKMEEYLQQRTVEEMDYEILKRDAEATMDHIARVASGELRYQVFRRVALRLDSLIKHYRRFFERFAEVEADARADMELLKRKDVGRVGSIINIYSDPQQKARILSAISGGGDADRLEDVLRADNIAGSGVFDIAMQGVREERAESGVYRDDRNIVRRLLDSMNNDNRAVIRRNAEFRRLSGISVMEALEEACGKGCEDKTTFRANLRTAMESLFISAVEMAAPTLRIEETLADDPHYINPSEIWRVLLSYTTARYIKKNADAYGLLLPDGVGEQEVITSCAEEFAKKYIHPRARVSVVADMPGNVMYITGEMMDITPVRIAKINEMGKVPGYYPYYCRVLTQRRETGSDLWNPHLGFQCYKRAVLPYINGEMETYYDSRAAKAMLYGFLTGQLIYTKTKQDGDRFHVLRSLGECEVCTWDGEQIGESNASYLFSWMRDDEIRVDSWSQRLDEMLDREVKRLPIAVNEDEIGSLNKKISDLPYMKMLRDGLCLTGAKPKKAADGKSAPEARLFDVFTFADMVKRSEETRRDHNDAEKFLRAAFDLFERICITAAPPYVHLDVCLGVYMAQLQKLCDSYLTPLMVKTSVKEKAEAAKAAKEALETAKKAQKEAEKNAKAAKEEAARAIKAASKAKTKDAELDKQASEAEKAAERAEKEAEKRAEETAKAVDAAAKAEKAKNAAEASLEASVSRVFSWVNTTGVFTPINEQTPLAEDGSLQYVPFTDLRGLTK